MPSADKLASGQTAIPRQLAAFLGARRDHVLGGWKAALRQNRQAGRIPTVDDAGLIDHLPSLFDDLIATLRGEAALLAKTSDDAQQHGQTRWEQHYSLDEVLRELGIVSRLLFEHGFDAFADAHLDMDRGALRSTRETILSFFEGMACGSARQYVLRQQEQTDTAHEEGRLRLPG